MTNPKDAAVIKVNKDTIVTKKLTFKVTLSRSYVGTGGKVVIEEVNGEPSNIQLYDINGTVLVNINADELSMLIATMEEYEKGRKTDESA